MKWELLGDAGMAKRGVLLEEGPDCRVLLRESEHKWHAVDPRLFPTLFRPATKTVTRIVFEEDRRIPQGEFIPGGSWHVYWYERNGIKEPEQIRRADPRGGRATSDAILFTCSVVTEEVPL